VSSLPGTFYIFRDSGLDRTWTTRPLEGKGGMLKSLLEFIKEQRWIVLMLLLTLLGYIYSMMVSHANVQVYEAEDLPSSYKGEIDYPEPLAKNSYARLIHELTPGDGDKAAFFSPNIDLDPGDYQVSFAVRALQVWPGIEPLRFEVGYSARDDVLASQEVDVLGLNREAYEEITIDFSVDSVAPGVEFSERDHTTCWENGRKPCDLQCIQTPARWAHKA